MAEIRDTMENILESLRQALEPVLDALEPLRERLFPKPPEGAEEKRPEEAGPLGRIKKFLEARYRQLEDYHKSTGIRLPFPVFLALIFVFAVATAYILFNVLSLGPLITIVSFVSVCTLIVGVPVSMRDNRINAVEQNLPDVLKHMAAVLKAGGTTESALEEISKTEYGPLTEDIRAGLKQLREGRTFDEVLTDMARLSGSTLFIRTTSIIVDAKKAGAGLADIMSSIADDARDILRIRRERLSRTTMHVLFLYIAGMILGPFIFGFTISIVTYIGLGSAGALSEAGEGTAALLSTAANIETLNNLITAFIGLQLVITLFMVGVIREGKMLKYVLRIPFLVLFALLSFEGGKYFSNLIIGGGL
jgi:pilus assembly protein TadC